MTAKADRGRRLGALLFSIALTAVLTAAGAMLLEAAGIDVERRLWLARKALFGPERVGIFRPDPRLGWTHVPGSSGRQREVPDYDVRYHIDASGGRFVPGAADRTGPVVLFLGGSFTFGHGVEDAESYPALLQQRWPEWRVVNRATNAWGTGQSLLLLETLLEQKAPLAGVVYGFIGHHIRRNHRSEAWLHRLDQMAGRRRNPRFEITGGRPVFRGLADPALHALPDGPAQIEREVRMTVHLLAEMRRLAETRGVPLIGVHLPDWTGGEGVRVMQRALGEERVIDLTTALPYRRLHFPNDFHYTAKGHRAIANALAEPLGRMLRAANE